MKKVFYLACCIALVMSVGCAITNYDLITDNDQVANGQGSGVVNTNGKAKITPSSQVATTYPDGSDELFSMVDQKANGDRTITTYNDPLFHDDLYCNPDWSGCAVVTADDPQSGDTDIFDYSANANCRGYRSLSLLLSTGRYYGECGRANISVSDRIGLMNMGTIGVQDGQEGLLYNLGRNNFSVKLDNNAGVVTSLPVIGDANVFVNVGTRQLSVDATNRLLANMGRSLADFSRNYGTGTTTITMTLNGISKSFTVGGLDADTITMNVNRTF